MAESWPLTASSVKNLKSKMARSKILRPLAALFGMGVTLRGTAYRRGWLRPRRLNRPVVSVGNLSVGGTGKTPLVMLIAELLFRQGWNPGILTRGYGRRRGAKTIVLAPDGARSPSPRDVGDEPALLARALPQVPIVVCANRYQGGRVAEGRFDVGVHILDDGFQHRALARDVDVVTLDATQEPAEEALLPVGRLREPPSALARAHLVVITRVELVDPQPLEDRVRRINPRAEIFHAATQLCELVDIQTGRIYPPDAFQGEPVEAYCGIGNPKAFFADLRMWGFSVVDEHSFPDHHVHTAATLLVLNSVIRKSRPAALVTTEKDAMNLLEIPAIGRFAEKVAMSLRPLKTVAEVPILACVIRSELRDRQAFEEALFARLGVARPTN